MKSLGGSDSGKKAEKIDFSKVKIEPLFEDMVDFETFAKSDYRAVKVINCVAVPKSKKLLQFTLDADFCGSVIGKFLCGKFM